MDKKSRTIINLEVISRGFVFMKESEKLIDEAKKKARKIAQICISSQGKAIDWQPLKNKIANQVSDFLFTKTGRRPMILPLIIEI